MYNKIDLKNKLESIHRKSYPAYKSLRGSYTFGDFVLSIDHVQGDPFAAPSSLHVELPLKKAGFPEIPGKKTYKNSTGRFDFT